MSGTLGVMKARIADEMSRTDLTTQIANAIFSAIHHYERQRFWFNEARVTVTTSTGQSFYDSADNAQLGSLVEIDGVTLQVGSVSWPLKQLAWSEIEELVSGTQVTGEPTHYAWYGEQLRLYPIPNAARTVVLSYVKRLADLATDTDANAWTLLADAEELIRLRARVDLAETTTGEEGTPVVQVLRAREREVLARLLRETNAKRGPGRIVATRF